MTDNERVLHTVLSTCLKPHYKCEHDRDTITMLEDRIDEIRKIVEAQVEHNARMNVPTIA